MGIGVLTGIHERFFLSIQGSPIDTPDYVSTVYDTASHLTERVGR